MIRIKYSIRAFIKKDTGKKIAQLRENVSALIHEPLCFQSVSFGQRYSFQKPHPKFGVIALLQTRCQFMLQPLNTKNHLA